MLVVDQSASIADSVFRLFRFVLQCLIFLVAIASVRWVVHTFLLRGGEKSNRRRHTYSGVAVVALVVLLVVRRPAERLLTTVGNGISGLRSGSELDWLTGMLVGFYYVI